MRWTRAQVGSRPEFAIRHGCWKQATSCWVACPFFEFCGCWPAWCEFRSTNASYGICGGVLAAVNLKQAISYCEMALPLWEMSQRRRPRVSRVDYAGLPDGIERRTCRAP